eukprot:3566553-Prymnesium_polylepis.1
MWRVDAHHVTTWMVVSQLADSVSVLAVAAPSGVAGDRPGMRKGLIYLSTVVYVPTLLLVSLGKGGMACFVALFIAFGVAHGIQKSTDFGLLLDLIRGRATEGLTVGLWQAAGALGSIAGSLWFGLFLELFRTTDEESDTSYSRTGYLFAFSSAAALICASACAVRAIPARHSVTRETGSSTSSGAAGGGC